MSEKPLLGQRVLYCLTKQDAERIVQLRDQADRALSGQRGNYVAEGQYFAADVVQTFMGSTDGRANLQVRLDGPDSYWATSVPFGQGPGTWQRTAF